MRRRSASAFARWERKRRVPKWRHTNTQPPAPADRRLASWCPGNAPAAKTTERSISNAARAPSPAKNKGSPERAALIFFSIESREPRLHAGEGARATRSYLVSILKFIFTVGRVSHYLTILVS